MRTATGGTAYGAPSPLPSSRPTLAPGRDRADDGSVPRPTRARRDLGSTRAAGRGAVVVAVVALAVAACSAPSPRSSNADGVVVATCRGFAPTGPLLGDRLLLARAVAAWEHDASPRGATADRATDLAPPQGTVCVVGARFESGRVFVTMLDRAQLVTYEGVPGGTGQVSLHSDLPDPAPLTLPAIPVGEGRWQLGATVTQAEVWVGAPDAAPVHVTVPAGTRVVDVQQVVLDYARRHPTALAHLLLLARTPTGVYAATGGAPYAPSLDEVLPVALSTRDTTVAAAWDGYRALLAEPSGVPLLAQSVGFTRSGRQPAQRLSRLVTVIGRTTARTAGPVLVVGEEPPDGSHGSPALVEVVQRSRDGADVQPVGVVLYPTGGWVGHVWLQPVQAGDLDPLELLVVGRPPLPGDPPLTIGVSGANGATVSVRGPVGIVPSAAVETPDLSGNRPYVAVTGHTADGGLVLPLGAG